MPDHAHFLWLGLNERSDQRKASALFRKTWQADLASYGYNLQSQAYDHVLRKIETDRGALAKIAAYILKNPVRAGLTVDWRRYRFSGALVPGYPILDVRDEDFWERFWRIYNRNAG